MLGNVIFANNISKELLHSIANHAILMLAQDAMLEYNHLS
jgi:hypothetical protein